MAVHSYTLQVDRMCLIICDVSSPQNHRAPGLLPPTCGVIPRGGDRAKTSPLPWTTTVRRLLSRSWRLKLWKCWLVIPKYVASSFSLAGGFESRAIGARATGRSDEEETAILLNYVGETPGRQVFPVERRLKSLFTREIVLQSKSRE